jgi:hypothetical protein
MDQKCRRLARALERALSNGAECRLSEAGRLTTLRTKLARARETGRRPSRETLAMILHSGVASTALAEFLDLPCDASHEDVLRAIQGQSRQSIRVADAASVAAQIVRDATIVDWTREPQLGYERAIRQKFIAQHLAEVPHGWMTLMFMAMECDPEPAADLAAAAEEAERRSCSRIRDADLQSLRKARRAVDRDALGGSE